MDTLLTNAANSIAIGVEDFRSNDPRRAVSAVRNLHAGILLLFKEKLRQLSPPDTDEVLLKQKISPRKTSAGVSFTGAGRKTVDIQQIKDRFESLDVSADWGRVDRITKARNEIEHYWTDQTAAQLKEVVANTFAAIGPFISRELQLEPIELLGSETWTVLLEEAEVYEQQREECLIALGSVNWLTEALAGAVELLRCPHCRSNLVKPTDLHTTDPVWSECRCTSCGAKFSLSDQVVLELLQEHLFADAYIAMTDGGDPPYTFCPHCNEEAYISEEDVCAICQETRTYTECVICGAGLNTEEQEFGGLCGYHHHTATKDD